MRGSGRCVEERKKRERKRPTDRRMRPGDVFNWEECWVLFLWAVLPSIHGRRNTIHPAQFFAFLRYLSALILPAACDCGALCGFARAAIESEGKQRSGYKELKKHRRCE